ncbi:hypothetical protein [Natranaeroarchaeum sulfidigenes]|uniref:Uncharacterized protein n=1 Tax=Natranaeroarchaeum sulfidigenes TaxID=2784880 RepID=A0A897MRL1_9EURY|nr:hypothetical protein [Natranaeroarchaeum sulfidigenes]QSG01609.1 hypothetical protein AArcS_0380 [Natranaeroarchaeum sulfidigenes]
MKEINRRKFILCSTSTTIASFGAAGAVTADDETERFDYSEVDDLGNPIEKGVTSTVEGVSTSSTNPDDPPNATIEASEFEWIDVEPDEHGDDTTALRLSDDGGVNFNFQYETEGDLTADIIWRHHSGDQLAYLFNDLDSTQFGFRAFTNGIAGNGLFFRNPFGGDDIFVNDDFQDGKWYKIRIVLDADENTYIVFINGDEIAEVFYDGSGFVTSDDFRIMGRKSGSPTLINYRYFAWANNVVLPGDADRVDSEHLQLDLEEGEGDSINNEPKEQIQIEPLIDDKIALAGEIDDVGATLNEQPQVKRTLTNLERNVDDGEISADRASEAIKRKQIGESTTRSYVGGLSPRDTSNFDTGGEITGLAITAGAQGLIGAAAIGRVANFVGWGRLGSRLGSAKDRIKRGIDKAVDTLVGASSRVSRFVHTRANQTGTFLRELIIDGGITTGATLADELASRVEGAREQGGDLVLQFYEQLIPGRTVSDDLARLDQTLGPADGGPTFEGTTENARRANKKAVENIEETLEDTEQTINRIENGLTIASFLGVAATALVVSGWGSAIGLALSLVELVISVAAALGGVAVGLDGIRRAHRTHNDSIGAVINGQPGV